MNAILGLPTAIRPIPEPVIATSPGARAWARLIARIYEVDPLRCRRFGGSMRLTERATQRRSEGAARAAGVVARRPNAFITEGAVIVRILDHLGEPTRAPRMAPIRGPLGIDALQQRDDCGTRRSLNLDPPVDVMPDYENQNQDLVW